MDYGKKLSHAYIVSASPEEGLAKARELAAAMLCESEGERPCGGCRHCRKSLRGIHPDIMVRTRPLDDKGKMKKEYPVEYMREIVSSSVVMPNEAEKKVYIIRDAGAMNTSAQNALLKLLEEPPYFVAVILISETPRLLLETIRSRCVSINLQGDADAPPAEARDRAEKYLALAAKGDGLGLVAFAEENKDMSVAEAMEFVTAAIDMLTDMLCFRLPDLKLSRCELLRLTELMERAQRYLRQNVSSKHILGLLSVCTIETK